MTVMGDFRASAADLREYTLTPAQTLALYGSEIELEIYANNATYTKNAVYVGDTAALQELNGFPTGYSGDTYIPGGYSVDNRYNWGGVTRARMSRFLIYRVYIDPYSPPYAMPFSVNLTNSVGIIAEGFGTQVLWSISGDPTLSPGYDAGQVGNESSYTLYGESVGDVLTTGTILAAGDSGANTGYYGGMLSQVYGCEVQEEQGLYFFGQDACINFFGACAFAGTTQTGGQPVTVGSQQIYIKNESNVFPKTGYSVQTGNLYNKLQQQEDNSDYCTYILVQCPTLYGDYTLPDGEPGEIDLTQIEEYLGNISEESTVQTRQLIAILAKLEQIYTAIQNSGFNPSLNQTAAQTLPRLDWATQQSAIASGTISAQDVADMTPAGEMLTDTLGDVLSASGLTLFAVGLVSLCAAGWFLTSGRGG